MQNCRLFRQTRDPRRPRTQTPADSAVYSSHQTPLPTLGDQLGGDGRGQGLDQGIAGIPQHAQHVRQLDRSLRCPQGPPQLGLREWGAQSRINNGRTIPGHQRCSEPAHPEGVGQCRVVQEAIGHAWLVGAAHIRGELVLDQRWREVRAHSELACGAMWTHDRVFSKTQGRASVRPILDPPPDPPRDKRVLLSRVAATSLARPAKYSSAKSSSCE